MPTLQLEHPVKDFAMWKAAFDRDPIDRRGLGVRAHRVFRPFDDPNYVVVELDFDTRDQADTCHAALRDLWAGRTAAPALLGEPKVRIVDAVDVHEYE